MPEAAATHIGSPSPRKAAQALIVFVLALCSFTIIFTNQMIAPILVDISRDFHIGVELGGQLNTVYGLAAGLVALLLGPFLDWQGRRRLLLWGLVLITVATFAATMAPSFAVLLGTRILAGIGAAAAQPALQALVGDLFAYERRGKAMGLVNTGGALATLVGIPLGTLFAQLRNWRWTFLFLGAWLLVALLALFFRFPVLRTPRTVAPRPQAYFSSFATLLRQRQVVAIIAIALTMATGFFAWQTYMGAFFVQKYGLSTGLLAPLFATFGAGSLVGANLGGVAGDRWGKRRIALISLSLLGFFIVIITNVSFSIELAVLVFVLLALAHAARMVNVDTLATEVTPEQRGAMMALMLSLRRFGTTSGALFGGIALASGGYATLGWLSAGALALTVLILFFGIPEPGSPSRGPQGR